MLLLPEARSQANIVNKVFFCLFRHGNGAAIAMDVDGPRAEEVRQRKRDLKDFVQRQKLEAEALKKAA